MIYRKSGITPSRKKGVFVTATTSVGMEIINQVQTEYPNVKHVDLIGVLFFPYTKF